MRYLEQDRNLCYGNTISATFYNKNIQIENAFVLNKLLQLLQ